MSDELQEFIKVWDAEARKTASVIRSLPASQYDFRPDAGGRSLGELAWHLAEIDAYMTHGIEAGRFGAGGQKPPGIERPRDVEALAPGYERIHLDAKARVQKLTASDLNRMLKFFDGSDMMIRDILWGAVVMHAIHHRGQLVLMCRLAGGTPPGIYGFTREEMAARTKAAKV